MSLCEKSIWSADKDWSTEWMKVGSKAALKVPSPKNTEDRVWDTLRHNKHSLRPAINSPWLLSLWSLPSLLYISELKEISINYSLNKSLMLETHETDRLLWWKVKGPDPVLLITFYSTRRSAKWKKTQKTVWNPCKEPKHKRSQVPGQSIIYAPCKYYSLRKSTKCQPH